MTTSHSRDLLDAVTRYGMMTDRVARLRHDVTNAGSEALLRAEVDVHNAYRAVVAAVLEQPGGDLRAVRVLPSDLIADYVPDSSGRYRIYRVGDVLVTRITSISDGEFEIGEVFEHYLHRAPWYDGDGAAWMLTDTYGSGESPKSVDDVIVWIDGEAYTCESARDILARIVNPPADPVAEAVIDAGGEVVHAHPGGAS